MFLPNNCYYCKHFKRICLGWGKCDFYKYTIDNYQRPECCTAYEHITRPTSLTDTVLSEYNITKEKPNNEELF